MATDLGRAYIQIMPSAQGISGSIQGLIGGEASVAGNVSGSMLGGNLIKTVSKVIAAAGIGKLLTDSLMEGANLQQSLGGVETLFKENADKVKNYANEAYKTAGLSANAYMESVTSFSASLLQSLGGDTEKAAESANQALIDMSDNANKMGTSMESIQNAYQGFAKQNYTMLDNLKLGYGGTKEEMQRLLADAQKLTGVKYDLNNLSDVYSAIHAIQDNLGITGTTAKEASETFSGSFESMKASVQNLLGKLSLGQDIAPSLKALAETTGTFLFKNLLPMIGNILKGIPEIIQVAFTEGIPALLQSGQDLLNTLGEGIISGYPVLLQQFNEVVQSVLQFVTDNLPTFLNQGVEILTHIGSGIVEQIPTLISTASEIINSFVEFLMNNIPTILQAGVDLIFGLVDGLISNIPEIGSAAFKAVMSFINTIANNYPKYVSAGFEVLGKFLSGILDRIPKILSAIGNLAGDIINKITSIDLFEAGKAILGGFLNGLKSVWDGVTGFIGGIGSWIAEHKGPLSYDRRLLIPAGNAIMFGLNEGLENSFKHVKQTVVGVADNIQGLFNDGQYNFAVGADLAEMQSNNYRRAYSKDLENSTYLEQQLNYPNVVETHIHFKEKEIATLLTPVITKQQRSDETINKLLKGEKYV
ncbi:PblA [Carnobacteriaceae bacterium zg-ZUI240]|nr:PblA [Carnobacteriaceae bacterium zg-ZUI240]